jgi:hypothetical protein
VIADQAPTLLTKRYTRLNERLRDLDPDDDDVAERIRDEMDVIWRALTEDERVWLLNATWDGLPDELPNELSS